MTYFTYGNDKIENYMKFTIYYNDTDLNDFTLKKPGTSSDKFLTIGDIYKK